MMREINISIHIERPIEEVFSTLTDARFQPEWDSGLIEGRHEPDAPAQVGTKVTEIRKFMGRASENTSEIVEFEENRKMVRKGENRSMTLTGILTFTETDSGTDVDWTWILEITGLLSLITPIMARMLKRGGKSALSGLKYFLENDKRQSLDSLTV